MEQLIQDLTQILKTGVEENCFTCASISVVCNGQEMYVSTGELGNNSVDETTLFDVASVTKVVPTSLLSLLCLDRGLISLDTPINEISDRLDVRSDVAVTFRDLLTQTVEFPFALSQLKDLPVTELLKKITHAELRVTPGSTFAYCNASSILQGIIVEDILGDTLYNLAQKELFDKFELKNSYFKLSPLKIKDVVPTEIDSWRNRTVQGEVHDESSWLMSNIIDPGAAGLFSCSKDLLKIIDLILKDDGSFLQEGTFSDVAKNWIPSVENAKSALGFEFDQPFMGKLRSEKTIGKTGFTGSSIVADINRKAGVVFLTNYTWPHRKPDRNQIIAYRQKITDVVWQWCDDK